MAQQTAVEWFINEIESKGEAWENASIRRVQISIDVSEYLELKRQAKQMFEEQHGKTWDEAIKANENRGNVIARSICDFDDYYNETYGK